jgi:hypothetical protein
MNVIDAARKLNKSPEYIRVGLQLGRLPFGTAVKVSSKWSYHISDKLFNEYIGGADEK